MKIVSVQSLAFPEVKVMQYQRFLDERGYFSEVSRLEDFKTNSEVSFLKDIEFVQTNESFSHAGVIRGLHFQWQPFQGKLVRAVSGHAIDIILDIRKNSPTFGKIILCNLPAHADVAESHWLWVPPGFAHGFCALENLILEYMCTSVWSPQSEAGIFPFSTDIDWSLADPQLKNQIDQLKPNAVLNVKDRKGFSLESWLKDSNSNYFTYGKI
jgi:dTDP-4-dehydrorhamnose 3,5-epimerase